MKEAFRQAALLLAFPLVLAAQDETSDTSPHTQCFVEVEPGVELEVLDWGGTGRPVVLLAGRGSTAHVFDELAPKLTPHYRVYGITRRGHGNSTATLSGFLADSLADDVLAVMDSLKIRDPVLIGHSLAGQELSSIGSRHPERVAGLVYLDAGFHFAFYAVPGLASVRVAQRKLARLADPSVGLTVRERSAIVRELLETDLPDLEAYLRGYQERIDAYTGDLDAVLPRPDPNPRNRALALGQQKYTDIRAPVLAIFALPREVPERFADDPEMRARWDSASVANLSPQIDAFERGVPTARVVRLPHASHHVFRSHEADVLREIRAFIAGLPPSTGAAEPEPVACRGKGAATMAYFIDGEPAKCQSAMAFPRGRNASIPRNG
jgi:non-heme chloroperoxidase